MRNEKIMKGLKCVNVLASNDSLMFLTLAVICESGSESNRKRKLKICKSTE